VIVVVVSVVVVVVADMIGNGDGDSNMDVGPTDLIGSTIRMERRAPSCRGSARSKTRSSSRPSFDYRPNVVVSVV
jgi:hypothetical protein